MQHPADHFGGWRKQENNCSFSKKEKVKKIYSFLIRNLQFVLQMLHLFLLQSLRVNGLRNRL